MEKIYYIGHFVEKFHDGGQSRNKAFLKAFQSLNARLILVYNSSFIVRCFLWIQTLWILFFSKRNKIFIHQGSIIILFPISILKYSFFRKAVIKLLSHTAYNNELIIEVNDLPYEQAIDLELRVNITELYMQNELYSIKNAKYIFASYEMAKYVNNKINIDYKVIINGANPLKEFASDFNLILNNFFESNEVKYIYVGGLNKGRQIESLISIFIGRKEHLVLIGEMGDWLLNYQLSNNIHYLGSFSEDYAHYLTSLCDVGLIPYEEKRLYYNLCYPTKASFYITAGIPFLSTPLRELRNHFEKSETCYFVSFKDWRSFINNISEFNIKKKKQMIISLRANYYWDFLIGSNIATNIGKM
jgi:glycosyltransferase involved in cell wall biosynthesis